jgi:uncharacterized protein YecT (DUF1311 family)
MSFVLVVALTAVNATEPGGDNAALCAQLDHATREMNEVYSSVLKSAQGDNVAIAAIKNAQEAWLAWLEAEAMAVFPPVPDMQSRYGSMYGGCRCRLLTKLTKERIGQLKGWLPGSTRDPCEQIAPPGQGK